MKNFDSFLASWSGVSNFNSYIICIIFASLNNEVIMKDDYIKILYILLTYETKYTRYPVISIHFEDQVMFYESELGV